MDDLTRKTWQLFRDARVRTWGTDKLKLSDKTGLAVAVLSDGWIVYPVVDEINGTPEVEINILEQSAFSDAMVQGARYFTIRGVMYEKRSDMMRNPNPRFWNCRAQPVNH